MISYAMVGSNDLEKAKKFYDEVLGVIGVAPLMEHPSGGRMYGAMGQPMFGVVGPYNKEPATFGNGTMIALGMQSRDDVNRVYAKAIELGGKDEGAPGIRGPEGSTFYMAYFRDLDGNKLALANFG
ncbi:MAG: VOC family protein [Caulobacterales bacterium]